MLDIGFNSIKATGLNVLMKVIADSNQLESLSISGNTVDAPAAKAVAYALAYNCSLEALFLVHCTINHEGQRHITAGIVSNARIALRKLTGFRIGRTCFQISFLCSYIYLTYNFDSDDCYAWIPRGIAALDEWAGSKVHPSHVE